MISWHVNMTWSVVISGHVPVEPLSPKDGNHRPQRGGEPFAVEWEHPFPKDGNLIFQWASPFQNQAGGFGFDINSAFQ